MHTLTYCIDCECSYQGGFNPNGDDRKILLNTKKNPFEFCSNQDCGATIGGSFCRWLTQYAKDNISYFLCVSKNCDCCANPYACGNRIGITAELLEATFIEYMDDNEFWSILNQSKKYPPFPEHVMDYYNNPSKTDALIKEFIIISVKTGDWSYEIIDVDDYQGELICKECTEQRKYE